MFEVKVAESVAQEDVNALLAFQKKLPNKIKDLSKPIEQLVEAVSLGIAEIDRTTFVITHRLIEPVTDASGTTEVLNTLVYKPRPDPTTVTRETAKLKPGSNQSTVLLMHASIATGITVGELSKLRESDADIRDAISALFL